MRCRQPSPPFPAPPRQCIPGSQWAEAPQAPACPGPALPTPCRPHAQVPGWGCSRHCLALPAWQEAQSPSSEPGASGETVRLGPVEGHLGDACHPEGWVLWLEEGVLASTGRLQGTRMQGEEKLVEWAQYPNQGHARLHPDGLGWAQKSACFTNIQALLRPADHSLSPEADPCLSLLQSPLWHGMACFIHVPQDRFWDKLIVLVPSMPTPLEHCPPGPRCAKCQVPSPAPSLVCLFPDDSREVGHRLGALRAQASWI